MYPYGGNSQDQQVPYQQPGIGFQPQGSPYPQAPGYPPTGGPGYPPAGGPGYPPAGGAPGYPPAGGGPGYPPAPGGTPGYPPAPGGTPGYPPAPGYPPQQQQPGYPSATPGYPAQQQPGYPGYPPQQAYPQQQQGYPAATPAYPAAQPPSYQPYQQQQQQQQQPFGQSSFSNLGSQPAAAAVMTTQQYTETPTIIEGPFDAMADAQVLRKAMKGFGTDEASIINVLGRRTSNQRQQIAQAFKSGFGRDLVKDLKSELGGKLEDVCVSLMTPRFDYMAQRLNKAISGIGTRERTLVDVLCTATNAEIMEINRAYYRLFGRPLEKDLVGDTSGHFQRLLVSVNTGARNEDPVANPAMATEDAQNLYQAGEKRMGTDESAFNMVLATRSFAQIRLMLHEYERIAGHSLEKAISNEFSGNVEDGLLAVVKSARNRAAYFAERLYESMAGMGTKDEDLIFICVTRAEVDMENIKVEYNKMYHKSLAQAINGDTSGDYKKILMALIGC